ncbi:hypothetical protein HAX54_048941 [Datura stramonium]|uniref:Uncharacterized protein n=1 Tax=Datura stramonium TaxID=4076 RepID=A0ABS8SUZ6_DATST|nr:hypothetical protein [Datura stramonium]
MDAYIMLKQMEREINMRPAAHLVVGEPRNEEIREDRVVSSGLAVKERRRGEEGGERGLWWSARDRRSRGGVWLEGGVAVVFWSEVRLEAVVVVRCADLQWLLKIMEREGEKEGEGEGFPEVSDSGVALMVRRERDRGSRGSESGLGRGKN